MIIQGKALHTRTHDVMALMRVRSQDHARFVSGMILTDRTMKMSRTVTIEGGNIAESLTDEGLRLAAEHYGTKMGPSITICDVSKVKSMIETGKRSFGMIVTYPGTSHVTPIYFHYKEDGTSQTYVMDSIRATLKAPKLVESLIGVKNVAYSDGERQAASVGCRVDALTTLKYTHLAMQRGDRLPIVDKTSPNYKKFKLPSSWAPAAQILSGVDLSYDDIIITKKGLSAQQVRANHLRNGTIQIKLESQDQDKPYAIETHITKPLHCYLIDKNTKYLKIVRKHLAALDAREEARASCEYRGHITNQSILALIAMVFVAAVAMLVANIQVD